MTPHYKSIKLKNGELMACTVTEENSLTLSQIKNRAVLEVHNPVVFNSYRFMDQDGELVETISMQPLVPMTDSSVYELSTDHIFTLSDMRPMAAERYQEFLEHIAEVREAEALQAEHDANQPVNEQEQEEATTLLDMFKVDNKMLH